jgi:hypothetical protein
MNAHNDEVKRTVPADRLLVWSVKEGWGPLCDFLELPVPEGPFPHLNDSTPSSSTASSTAPWTR